MESAACWSLVVSLLVVSGLLLVGLCGALLVLRFAFLGWANRILVVLHLIVDLGRLVCGFFLLVFLCFGFGIWCCVVLLVWVWSWFVR